jgi:hypothetical protein
MGSDGRASAKGGGGGANSTTRGSGREGGERGADLSVVKMAGGVAPFYRVREKVEGSGGSAVRGTTGGASSTPVTGVEVRGWSFDEGEMKGRGRRFDSTPTECGWVTDGGVRTGGKPTGRWRRLRREVEDDPVMGQMGRSGPRWPGCGWAGVGISKENRDGLPWPLGRTDGLNRRAYRKCF